MIRREARTNDRAKAAGEACIARQELIAMRANDCQEAGVRGEVNGIHASVEVSAIADDPPAATR
jgi:hypothetical protein